MGLRLKAGINKLVLRKYGFKFPEEFKNERWYSEFTSKEWMYKFLMDEEDPNRIAYIEEEFDIPMVEMFFRFGKNYEGDLYIDCSPPCTYHIGGTNLNIVTDTIYQLVQDGIVELY